MPTRDRHLEHGGPALRDRRRRLPFDDGNVQRLLQKIVATELVSRSSMSLALVDLLQKMAVKEPQLPNRC
jgi:hypothetical protein